MTSLPGSSPPADGVVARVVGASRGLKELEPADVAGPEAQEPASTTLPDALSPLSSAGASPLVVVEGNGRPRGQSSVACSGPTLAAPE